MTTPTRLVSFVAARFTPPVYASYGILWAVSLEAATSALAGSPWRPSWLSLLRAVTVVFALLFLRMLDEQKDLSYDRVHNPSRPLVTGAITTAELRSAMAALALLGFVANLAVSLVSALLYLAILAYGLLLALAERRYSRIADDPLLALFAAYPVQIVVSLYLLVSVGTPFIWGIFAVLLAYAGAFLHFEFARKTRWEAGTSERLYSEPLGPLGSALAAALSAAAACIGLLLVCLPHGPFALLPCLVTLPAAWGLTVFLGRRTGGWPTAPAMAVILTTHLALLVVGYFASP